MSKIRFVLLGVGLGCCVTTVGFLIAAQTPGILPGPMRSPGLYKTLYEDDAIRLVDYRLKPGEKEPLHSHCAGVVYSLEASTAKSTTADGVVSEGSGQAGVARGRKAMAHALENTGSTDIHALSFELKGSCQ